MKTLVLAALLVSSSVVFATGSNHHNVYDNSVVNKGGSAVSDSYATGGNSHSNATGGTSDSYSNSNAMGGNSGGNSMNMNYTTNNQRQFHNTPALSSLFGTPTAPCALPVGGTGAGAGFGFGFITAYINEECIKQETTKLAYALGKADMADEILCSMEHAKNTHECSLIKAKFDQLRGVAQVTTSEIKRGLFGTVWDENQKQWVFNSVSR